MSADSLDTIRKTHSHYFSDEESDDGLFNALSAWCRRAGLFASVGRKVASGGRCATAVASRSQTVAATRYVPTPTNSSPERPAERVALAARTLPELDRPPALGEHAAAEQQTFDHVDAGITAHRAHAHPQARDERVAAPDPEPQAHALDHGSGCGRRGQGNPAAVRGSPDRRQGQEVVAELGCTAACRTRSSADSTRSVAPGTPRGCPPRSRGRRCSRTSLRSRLPSPRPMTTMRARPRKGSHCHRR